MCDRCGQRQCQRRAVQLERQRRLVERAVMNHGVVLDVEQRILLGGVEASDRADPPANAATPRRSPVRRGTPVVRTDPGYGRDGRPGRPWRGCRAAGRRRYRRRARRMRGPRAMTALADCPAGQGNSARRWRLTHVRVATARRARDSPADGQGAAAHEGQRAVGAPRRHRCQRLRGGPLSDQRHRRARERGEIAGADRGVLAKLGQRIVVEHRLEPGQDRGIEPAPAHTAGRVAPRASPEPSCRRADRRRRPHGCEATAYRNRNRTAIPKLIDWRRRRSSARRSS